MVNVSTRIDCLSLVIVFNCLSDSLDIVLLNESNDLRYVHVKIPNRQLVLISEPDEDLIHPITVACLNHKSG